MISALERIFTIKHIKAPISKKKLGQFMQRTESYNSFWKKFNEIVDRRGAGNV